MPATSDVLIRDGDRPPGAAPRSHRRVTTVVAAVIVLFAAGAVVVSRDGDGRLAELATPPRDDAPSTTARPVPATTMIPANVPRPRTAIPVPARPPANLFAATASRLVVYSTATGAEVRGLAQLSTARTPEIGPTTFERVVLAPGGGAVYFVTCCEPAVGATYRLPAGGGAATLFTDGRSAAVTPDGTAIAVADSVLGIKLVSPGGALLAIIATRPDLQTLSALAWSPDSQRLAFVSGGRLFTVPSGAQTLDGASELSPPAGRRWRSPVFRSDGSLLVIESGGAADVVRAVPGGGTIDLGGRTPASLAADPSGGWVAVASTEGPVLAVGPGGAVTTTTVTGPFRSVAW